MAYYQNLGLFSGHCDSFSEATLLIFGKERKAARVNHHLELLLTHHSSIRQTLNIQVMSISTHNISEAESILRTVM